MPVCHHSDDRRKGGSLKILEAIAIRNRGALVIDAVAATAGVWLSCVGAGSLESHSPGRAVGERNELA